MLSSQGLARPGLVSATSVGRLDILLRNAMPEIREGPSIKLQMTAAMRVLTWVTIYRVT